MSRIYVVGHVNPDTDAIASAMGYAWLLSTRQGQEMVPARLGPINPQTAWVLQRLKLDPPELLADASPRFESVARRLDSVTPDRPLSEAWAIAQRTGRVAPLVEADGRPYGLITGLSLFALLGERVGAHPDLQPTMLSDIFAQPSRMAADTGVPRFQATSRIRDALPRILREERTDFWVVDQQGRYLGVCRQPDLLNPPRLKLILVDHNEVSQSIGSLDEADLLEVLDHHRLGNPPTRLPIRFRVEPLGSTSTLVSERIEASGLSAPPDLAGLMLAGLVSDTLMMSSPTTTDRDRQAAERLGRWAFAGGGQLQGESLEGFSRQVLQVGAGLSAREPSAIVTSDLKAYEDARTTFGIAQVEVTDLVEVGDHLAMLEEALRQLRQARGWKFAMLMITDIVEGSSRLVLSGPQGLLAGLPYPILPDGTLEAQGVVSRKKQLLPVVLALLEG
jgi:manganese-dependent inorganic pyrophosphatase